MLCHYKQPFSEGLYLCLIGAGFRGEREQLVVTQKTLKNWLHQLALPGMALLLAGFSSLATAAPMCFSDVDGPNDPPGDGQGDITRFCLDNANLPTSFDVYMQWDDDGFNGANTGDACALFDTDGDPSGNIDYAICISVGGKPGSLAAGPLVYSCGNTDPDRCTSPGTISPSAGTTCSASVQSDDPFSAGDDHPDDTVGVCTIDPTDIPAGAVRTNLCSFPSINPNSAPKDCVGAIGGGFINIVKVADPDDGSNFNFTLDGQTYTISGSGAQSVSLTANQTYSVAETVPANWALSTASCVDNRTGLPVGSFDNIATMSGLALGASDDFTCTFSNTKNFVDLVLAKSVSDSTPDEGDTVTYTLQLTNNGPVAATAINITDIVPSGVTYVAGSITGGDSQDDSNPGTTGLNRWIVNSLASGSNTSLSFQVSVDAGTGGATITNTAVKTQAEPDTDSTADTPAIDITVNTPPVVDLVTTKVVDDGTPDEGQTIQYTLSVTNNGPDGATNVSVTDALPAGVTYVSDSPSQGSYVSGTGVWTVGGLANGAVATLTIDATVDVGEGGNTLTNTITNVSLTEGDPTGVGDDYSEAVVVNVPPVVDLVTTKVVDDGTPDEGQTIQYTLSVTNNGPDGATNVSVTDALPAGVTYVSDSPSQGSYVSGTGVWTVGGLANGAVATLTIDATVDVGEGGNTLTNTITNVSLTEGDPTGVGDDYSEAVVVNVSAVSAVNGIVWLDQNHDDIDQASEPLLPNWVVQLFQNGLLADATTTDSNGYYEFTDLEPGTGYSIDFEHPDNNVVWGQIADLTLDPGVQQVLIRACRSIRRELSMTR